MFADSPCRHMARLFALRAWSQGKHGVETPPLLLSCGLTLFSDKIKTSLVWLKKQQPELSEVSPCPCAPAAPVLCPESPLQPCRARAHSASSASAPRRWLCFRPGEGARSVSVGLSNLCRFFLTCGSPDWWGSCVPAPSPRADGAGISESAGEQGRLCQCFDTVRSELKAELPVKCSDQKRCLYLTWIPVFCEELTAGTCHRLWGGHKGFGVWGDAGTIPVLARLWKEM